VNTQKLCETKSDGTAICLTGDQLAALLAGQPVVQISGPSSPVISGTSTSPSISATDATGTPPVIQINGDNPAIIHVGDSYADLGATITGPQSDLNLAIKTFLNGQLVPNIVLDTSEAATATIDYVATDGAGLTSTSTRTVIIEPATVPAAATTTKP
jgi:hypothetical protein